MNFRTVAIQKQRDFDDLLFNNNYDRMLAVSYVASPDLLLEYLQSKRYKAIELVAGNNEQSLGNMSKEFKQSLKGSIDVIRKLMEYEASATLKIYVPSNSRIIHSKFYILLNSSSARVIVGSPNLTQTARKSHQENYVDCWDLELNSPLLARYEEDYEKIRSGCTLFLEDLRELCKGREKDDAQALQEAIGKWLSSDAGQQNPEEREVSHLIHASMEASFTNKGDPVLEVMLDSAPNNLRKKITKMLDLDIASKDRPQSALLLDALQKKLTGLPLMQVADSKVLISIDGFVSERSAPLPERKDTVNTALQNIEDYIDTFELGHTNDIEYVKTCCFEAIFFIFSAPFSHAYMKMKMQRVGSVDQRGPRYLFIIGPTHNGKSTFLKFGMKLLSGRLIQPLFGEDFKKRKVIQAQATGSVFPLCFDDTKRISEDIVKNYWERWWKKEIPSPQIVVTTNRPLEDWAKSRVIKLNFTTSFDPTMQDRERLNKIFEFNNAIFCWFSHLYLEMLNGGGEEWFKEDELYLARKAMKKLYDYADRKIPTYFPEKPIEEIYDQDLIEFEYWMKVKKGEIKEEASKLTITFTEDMESADIKKIRNLLPPSSNSAIMGKTIVVSDPNGFTSWRNTSPDSRRAAARKGGEGWLRHRLGLFK